MKVEYVGHQGDCMIYKISEIPEGERIKDKQCLDGVLAYGEVTGHAHQIVDGNVELFRIMTEAYSGLLFLDAKTETTIEHGKDKNFHGEDADQDYHLPVKLPVGRYLIGIVEETDHIAQVTRRVAD